MGRKIRNVVIAVVVLVALAVGLWMVTRPQPVGVDMARVDRGTIEVTVSGDGEVRLREVYDITAPVSGKVARSPVHEGDTVLKGNTLVAQIEPGEPAFLDERSRAQAEAVIEQAEAAVKLASAQISIAESDLDDAQRRLSRAVDLYEKGATSEASLEAAELAVDVAAAMLDSQHATYDMAKGDLAAARAVLIEPAAGDGGPAVSGCCVQIVAPVSGQVLSVANDSARVVAQGETLLSIGKMDDVELTVDLLSSDAMQIAPGAPAYVTRWGGDGVLRAEVRVIEPAAFTKVSALGIEEQRVTVRLDFTDPAEDLPPLGHGFRAYVSVVEWRGEDVLRLPISALFRQDGDWAVFAVVDGIAHLRMVKIGQRNTEMAEVLSGVEAGDIVIAHPSDKVADGGLVTDRQAVE